MTRIWSNFYMLIFYNNTLPKIPHVIGYMFNLYEWTCMGSVADSVFQLKDYPLWIKDENKKSMCPLLILPTFSKISKHLPAPKYIV